MSNEIAKKGWDFWVIFTLLVVMMGFIMTIALRMATKDDVAKKADKSDIARVESDIKEIRTLLIDHIKDGHKHKNRDRKPASEPVKSKSK